MSGEREPLGALVEHIEHRGQPDIERGPLSAGFRVLAVLEVDRVLPPGIVDQRVSEAAHRELTRELVVDGSVVPEISDVCHDASWSRTLAVPHRGLSVALR